ncbi:MAG: hypothetical protein J6J15_00295 [Oscillospiraceae bacterium]|nr:hypothetical protein [Oscillospiraceae bacterium]
MKIFPLAAYTFSHFAVDYVCLLTVLDPWGQKEIILGGTQNYALFVITYNFLAFGLQMIIGAFCDEHRKFPASAVGCVLVLIGALCGAFIPEAYPEYAFNLWTSVLFVGVGNAFFHVGGGIESLVHSGGKLRRSGIFVSSGALGVALGIYNCSRFTGGLDFIVPLMIFCAAICLIAHLKYPAGGEAEISGAANEKAGIWIVLGLALVSVMIRSFGGTTIPMEWKTTMKLGLVSGFAAFLGKFIGGFAADLFGAKRTGMITLLASLPLLVFGSGNMIISVIGIILFNMTMPITLGIVAQRLPKNPGLAFGLTTAALLLGAVPSFFAVISGKTFLLVPAVLVSAVCIYFSAENKKSIAEV